MLSSLASPNTQEDTLTAKFRLPPAYFCQAPARVTQTPSFHLAGDLWEANG